MSLNNTSDYYIVKHFDTNIRMKSRSGGFFTAVSDLILENAGVVYGCRMDTVYCAIHDKAETKQERDLFRGSKYIQSEIRDSYIQVLKDLKANRLVLFSGTPCQIVGLKAFIGSNKLLENLYTLDIVCHGVPSPLIWERYLKWLELKYGKIRNIDFRNKEEFGWRDHQESIYIGEKRLDRGIFTKIFYSHHPIRPCCFKCPYKCIETSADIRIADAWGVSNSNPEFDDNKGVSLVIINSDKGKQIFQKIAHNIEYKKVDINNYLQPPLKENYTMPRGRDKFWREFKYLPFCIFKLKYGGTGLRRLLKRIKK